MPFSPHLSYRIFERMSFCSFLLQPELSLYPVSPMSRDGWTDSKYDRNVFDLGAEKMDMRKLLSRYSFLTILKMALSGLDGTVSAPIELR